MKKRFFLLAVALLVGLVWIATLPHAIPAGAQSSPPPGTTPPPPTGGGGPLSGGIQPSLSKEVFIENWPPEVVVRITPSVGTAPLDVAVESLSTDSDGEIVSSRWDCGNGTSAETPTAICSYPEPGYYTIRLTVTDDDGAEKSAVAGIVHATPRPLALTGTEITNSEPLVFSVTRGVRLRAIGAFDDGSERVLTPDEVMWQSNAELVAEVTAFGLVIGKGRGVAEIIATHRESGLEDAVTVVVGMPLRELRIRCRTGTACFPALSLLFLQPGESAELTADAVFLDGVVSPDIGSAAAWKSVSSGILDVRKKGAGVTVTGVREGTAVLSVSVDAWESSFFVYVAENPELSSLLADLLELREGGLQSAAKLMEKLETLLQ